MLATPIAPLLATVADVATHPTGRWLILMPSLSGTRATARVQAWRLLTRTGAVLARHGVWILPHTPERLVAARRVSKDIEEIGGHCAICAASLLEGLTDAEIEALFRDARQGDYGALTEEATTLTKRVARGGRGAPAHAAARRTLARLERRLMELRAISFVPTSAQRDAELTLARLRAALHGGGHTVDGAPPLRARTWVTRRGVFVDRVASAWLIRRFIDPAALFRFVDPSSYTPLPGELRFDMSDGEYGHEGDHCTFETLCARFGLREAGHIAIGEMVHDLDCREARYGRAETPGLLRMLEGVAAMTLDDLTRIETAAPLLDALFRGLTVPGPLPSVAARPTRTRRPK